MLNKIVIAGRITTVPEVKYTTSGKAVCAVTVAVDRDKLDANGQRNTDFINVVFWGPLGEHVGKWWVKGQWIIVEGRLQGRIWTDKEGKNRRAWEIIANAAHFCGAKPSEQNNSVEPPMPVKSENGYNVGDFEPLTDDDDVPF